jgi:small-conductance mechanosensitive channel
MENTETAVAELQKQNEALRASLAAAEAALKKGGPAPIKGEYKGFRFQPGHKRVRDEQGNLCDTEQLLAAAADTEHEGHDAAVSVLDRLIKIEYAYFTKEVSAPANKKK